MTRIVRVLAVPAQGGYYYEDLTALQERRIPAEERYTAPAITPGFRRVREVAEAVSVGLVLDDGQVAWGDCVGVAYSGRAGRWPPFRSAEGVEVIQRVVAPFLEGRPLTRFRELAHSLDSLHQVVEERRPLPREPRARRLSRREFLTAPARLLASEEEEPPAEIVRQERPLHPAIHYGVSQALLRAVAMERRQTMAEVIAEEWDLPIPKGPVPIHAQCGGDRYHGADKMIARRLASLPHTLVDDIDEQLGQDAVRLAQYARWLRARIETAGGPDYRPTIHLDLHGALGKIYNNVLGKVLGDLYALELAVAPLPLRVESPVVMDSLPAQLEALRSLRDYIRIRKMQVQIVADEWANTLEDIRQFIAVRAADMIQIKTPDMGGIHHTVEAVLACKAAGIGAFLGGSCVETDLSARAAVHVALATQPAMILARPGMGVDEAVMITQNEMARALACIRGRHTSHGTNADPALKH